MFQTLPRPLFVLGLAGMLPQAFCLVMATDSASHYFAIAAACCYAAVILSFLGGMWWMAGALGGLREPGVYILAVMPSLAAWAALLPWCVGWTWPGPSLALLGVLLLMSPLADAALASRMALPAGWLRLRVVMAGGLGLLTLAIAAV
jgi:hypothetical protein